MHASPYAEMHFAERGEAELFVPRAMPYDPLTNDLHLMKWIARVMRRQLA